jgi:hypothetical protein
MSKVDYEVERKKSVLNVPSAVKFIKQFNIKRVVEGRGHDCGGLICDLYLRSVLIAEYHDDGWGGEPEINFKEGKEAKVTKMLNDINFGKIMFDNGWGFLKSVDEISTHTQIEHLISMLGEIKRLAKVQVKCKSKIIYGTEFYQKEIYWVGLKDLRALPLKQLQKTYDRIKGELKDNEKFFNSNEQLISLGVKL